jgi:putative FmdB family regulatory protein
MRGASVPIFEYQCRDCGNQFEFLVRAGASSPPACPSCQSADLERLLSIPAVQSETTHGLAMRAAKKRDVKQNKINVADQAAYEKEHRH